jgi:2',3'-cyclic-nucleotide 2'-phosphodiesterase (5'-nucleotidase family)
MATEFQWDMMAKLGYDVVTPGPNEMIEGLEKLQGLYGKAPQIQVVSANVTDKSGKQIWPDYTVIDRGGVKFGITGVTDPAFYAFNQSRGLQKHDDFEFKDMRETLDRVVPELRPKCDLLVVLLHTASKDAEKVLQGLDGVDVAVVGHQATYKFLPQKIGNTLTVQLGSRGQYVGVLQVTLDGPGNVTAYSGENRPLGDGVVPDPQLQVPVDAFAKKYKALEDAWVKEHGLSDDGT